MQENEKKQIDVFLNICDDELQNIVAISEYGKDIGLINSFYPRKKQQQSEKVIDVYNRLRKFIEENVLNYQYRLTLLNKITFLFQYGKIDCLKDDENVIEIIGSVIRDLKESSIYTLGIIINDEKIVVNSMDGTEDESITNIVEIIYKTIPQDDMSEYIKDISIRTKNFIDADSPYEDKKIIKKFLALKKEEDNVITVLKRRNTKETTTLLCRNYQGFKDNRVIKEYKESTTLWNGIGVNKGYVIGSYNNSTIEYGKTITGEEYYYATRNNSPTLCDITADFVKVPLTWKEFNAAIQGITLEEATPISSKIDAAENEYTFGYLEKLKSTKHFA